MSDVKWIQLKVNMFEDEKIRLIESMPDGDTLLVIWFKLLSQAGRTNAKGYIFLNENIPYTPEMLSTIFNRPLQTVRLALQTFKQFNMIDVDDGDFILIKNWEKHQNIEGMEQLKLSNAERQKRYRERKKQAALGIDAPSENSDSNVNSNVTRNVTDNVTSLTNNALDIDIDIDKEKDINNNKNNSSSNNEREREFNEFWSIYSKKVDKTKAKQKFALKRKKYSFEVIMAGTEAYMAECERKGTDKQYIKGPAVFLNGENFNDEYEQGGFANAEKIDDAEREARRAGLPF